MQTKKMGPRSTLPKRSGESESVAQLRQDAPSLASWISASAARPADSNEMYVSWAQLTIAPFVHVPPLRVVSGGVQCPALQGTPAGLTQCITTRSGNA